MEFLMAVIIMVILFSLMRGFAGGPENSIRLERKLDALLKHHGIELPRLSLEVQQLAKDPTKKIAAIKLHREYNPGLGLAEAKAEIEDFIKSTKSK